MKAKTKTALERELTEATATIQEMHALLEIWRKRVDHCDIEAAQARLSRDTYKEKLKMLMTRMKDQGIKIVVGSTPKLEGDTK